MGDLQTNIDSILGRSVKRIHLIPAETNRTADKYLVLECEDGVRFILSISNLTRPCPNDLIVLEEAAKEHGAFTVEEALRRRRGEALGPEEDLKGKRLNAADVTVDDARGIRDKEVNDA